MTSPAVAKLLKAASEVLAMAQELRDQDRPGDAIACAMFANEYVRAARSIENMEKASRAYDESKRRREEATGERSRS